MFIPYMDAYIYTYIQMLYVCIIWICICVIGEMTTHKFTKILFYFVTASSTHGGDLQTVKYNMKPTKNTYLV